MNVEPSAYELLSTSSFLSGNLCLPILPYILILVLSEGEIGLLSGLIGDYLSELLSLLKLLIR